MTIFKKFFVLLCCLSFIGSAQAQILDEEDDVPQNTNNTPSFAAPAAPSSNFSAPVSTVDADEELFEEMFSDYSEEEKDISKVKTFDDAIEQTADFIKKNVSFDKPKDVNVAQEEKELPPISGDLAIGMAKGSFNIYKDYHNEPACSFTVTLKSSLNRDLKSLGLHLVFSKHNFAYVFRNVPEGGTQNRTMRSHGDICYNLGGAPNINIHTCKIYGAGSSECAKRIHWVGKISD